MSTRRKFLAGSVSAVAGALATSTKARYQSSLSACAKKGGVCSEPLLLLASDSLRSTPRRDVAGLMDFIETNEYYGSWYPGTAEDVAGHLDEIHAAFPTNQL